jgi:L-threonylcarbamoyladenylate synthase
LVSDEARAADVLRQGGVIAHATEGVWGLACDAADRSAVERIVAMKQRDAHKGLIVIAGAAADFAQELALLSKAQTTAVTTSWPGHVTWILPNVRFSELITGGRATVACRVPAHLQARELCRAVGRILVSTSLNVSGEPPITEYSTAAREFSSVVDFVLPGIVDQPGKSSRISTINGETLRD